MQLALKHYSRYSAKTLAQETESENLTQFLEVAFNHPMQPLTTEFLKPAQLEFPSGPVPLNSPLYVYRPPVEDLALAEIEQPYGALRIRAPRKMGKSSLLTRILAHANAQAYRTVYIDFLAADSTVFESLDRLLRWFCTNVSKQLGFEPLLSVYWNEDLGSKVSCKVYFEEYLLQQSSVPIVLTLNEVNRIFEHPKTAHDFLSMLQSWYEQAKQSLLWHKLRFVVVQSTDGFLASNLKQSAFDAGLALTLFPFTLEQVQNLALQYDIKWADGKAGLQSLRPLHTLLGGQPYLVSLAFYHLCRSTFTLEQLLATAASPNGIYGQYLRELLAIIQSNSAFKTAMQQVISIGSVHLDTVTAYQLEGVGLIQLEGAFAQPSCELYRLYLQKYLVSQLT